MVRAGPGVVAVKPSLILAVAGISGQIKFHQKSVLRAAYDEENEEFEKADLKGKDLVAWKYQRFIKEYVKTVDSIDENIGLVLDYLNEQEDCLAFLDQ